MASRPALVPDLYTMRSRYTFLLSVLFSLYASAQSWELVTPVKNRGELASVRMVDATTGYTIDRMYGWVLKTTDAGASWERMPYNLIDHGRVLWMWDAQRGIIGGNLGRFYHTTDGWASVTEVYEITFGNVVAMHFVNDDLGWAGTESGKIARTTDGGHTWTEQTSGTTNAIVAMHFVNDTLGFAAATGAVLLRTTDGGATWTSLTTPITGNMRGIHFFDPLNGLAVGLGGQIIRTTDGGDTWTEQPSPTTNSLLGLFVRGDLLIAAGNWGTVMRSTDGGDSWTAQTTDQQDLYHAWIDPSGIGLVTGKGRVFRTVDNGASWQPVQIGTLHTVLNKVSFGTDQFGAAAGHLTMGGVEKGAIRTVDGGRTWTNIPTMGNVDWLGIHLRADGTGWIGGSEGATKSTTDFFATSTFHPGPEMAIRCAWAFDANTAIMGGGYINGGCYHTANAGQSWAQSPTGTPLDLWFVNDTLGFCGGEGGAIQRTTDGGLTWESLDEPSFAQINSVFFLNDTLGWFAGQGGGRTTDGGDTWTLMPGLPQYTMSIFFTDPDTGYAVSISGFVLRTTNGGTDWEEVVPALFDVTLGDAQLVDGTIVAVGESGDVWRATLGCPTVPHVPTVLRSGQTLCTAWRPQIQWYLDDEPLPGADGPCITTDVPGSYTVMITDALGCASAPSVPVQVIGTAVEGTGAERSRSAFSALPNPTSGELTLRFADAGPHTVLLCDAQGRVLRTERLNGPTAVVQLHALPAGLYFLRDVERGGAAVRVVRE